MIEDPVYEEFWQRDVEESIRQGNVKPFVEEAVLQVSNWGFSLADVKLQKKRRGRGILNLLKSFFSGSQEEFTGFLGPIHIWQVSNSSYLHCCYFFLLKYKICINIGTKVVSPIYNIYKSINISTNSGKSSIRN